MTTTYNYPDSYNTETQQKIRAIFYDYANRKKSNYSILKISENELAIIAYRIERELMGVSDDNEFVGLKDLTKE